MSEIADTNDTSDLQSASSSLSEARKEKGLSQKDVADQLYLTVSVIQNIDEGRFAQIPKPAFIKGYLRSYARLVGVSGDEMVKSYDRLAGVPCVSARAEEATQEAVGDNPFTGPVLRTGMFGLVAIVIVVGSVWWFSSSPEEPIVVVRGNSPEAIRISEPVVEPVGALRLPTRTNISAGANQADRNEVAAVVAQVADESLSNGSENSVPDEGSLQREAEGSLEDTAEGSLQREAEGSLLENAEGSLQREAEGSLQSSAEGSLQREAEGSLQSTAEGSLLEEVAVGFDGKQVDIQRNRLGETNYITVTTEGDALLELEFTDECWVEIEDGEGTAIYGDLNRSGDVLTITGVAPFEILLGNAKVVEITFDGNAVNLARFTRADDTAKVKVGTR